MSQLPRGPKEGSGKTTPAKLHAICVPHRVACGTLIPELGIDQLTRRSRHVPTQGKRSGRGHEHKDGVWPKAMSWGALVDV